MSGKLARSLSDCGRCGCLIGRMQPESDAQLLGRYARQGAEAAFNEIIARHAALVYSAALRQMGSQEAARDVAQGVFIDLAQKAQPLAEKLRPEASLVGWLYRSTRFAALNFLRDDQRRQTRERQAMQQLDLTKPTSEDTLDWEYLRPLLDQALSSLGEADREALLLRFFHNQDLRTVGRALGLSDDAAQKRVSRAVERLRALLARRGLAASAAALATAISANAVEIAPPGLMAALSSAATLAGNTLSASSTVAVAKTLAMTTLQKTLIGATLAIVAGAGIYEAYRAALLGDQVQSLQTQQMPLAEQLRQLQQERDEATNRLAVLSEEVAALKTNSAELLKLRRQVTELKLASANPARTTPDTLPLAAKSWADRVTQLKQRLEQTPGAAVPELKYLSEGDWLNAARSELVTEKDYRRAFATLRSAGENQCIMQMHKALGNYLTQNNQQFPTDISQLKPYFETAPEDAMLQRYAIVPASSAPNMKMGGDWLITVKNPVDEEYDSLWALGPKGFGATSYHGVKEQSVIAPALEAYKAANNGKEPQVPSDILPYLTTPEQQAAYQTLEQMRNAGAK